MMKRWGVVGVIFGSLATMSVGCGAEDPTEELSRSSQEAVGDARGTPFGGDALLPRAGCRGFHCDSELPPGRCAFARDCAASCVFPAGACVPGADELCMGYCLENDQCIPDPSCAGGLRCLECGGSTYGGGCIEICAPLPPPPAPPPAPPPPPPPGPPQQGPVQGPVQGPPQQGPVQQEPLPPPPPPKDDCPLDVPPAQLPPAQLPPVQSPPVQTPPGEDPFDLPY